MAMQYALEFEKMHMRARSVEVVDLRGRHPIFYSRKDYHTGCASVPCMATRQPFNMKIVACIDPLCRSHGSDPQGRRIAIAPAPPPTTRCRCAPQTAQMPARATPPTAAERTGLGSPPRPAHLAAATRADRGSSARPGLPTDAALTGFGSPSCPVPRRAAGWMRRESPVRPSALPQPPRHP